MVININNYIDINIYDYDTYFKCDLILKKPVKIDMLNKIINLVFQEE